MKLRYVALLLGCLMILLIGCESGTPFSSPASSEYIFSPAAISSQETYVAASVAESATSSVPEPVFSKEVTDYEIEKDLFSWNTYMLGEVEGKLLLASIDDNDTMLVYLDSETLAPSAQLIIKSEHQAYGVKIMDAKIYVRLTTKTVVVNLNLEIVEEIPLPKAVLDAFQIKDIQRGITFVRYGYDIAADLKTYCYNDSEGLKLLNSESGTTRLLQAAQLIKWPDGKYLCYNSLPQFVNNDRQIIANEPSYEEMGNCIRIDIETASISIIIGGDCGTCMPVQNGISGINFNNQLIYYDTTQNNTHEIDINTPFSSGYLRGFSESFAGKNYAVVETMLENDQARYLHRINLETMKVDENYLAVTFQGYNNIQILGVTESGRILLQIGDTLYITK